MKTKIFVTFCLLLLLAGCNPGVIVSDAHYAAFDTVIQLYAPGARTDLDSMSQYAFGRFDELSRLFDIYYGYTGMTNLYDVNRLAGQAPVAVAPEIMELLEYGKQAYELTGGRVNIAMGAVLSLWHQAREENKLPDKALLDASMAHCNIKDLVLDRENQTVYFTDPGMSLDVGAIAKGWACQVIADELEALGYGDFLIYAGGNVVARGFAGQKGWLQPQRLWKVGIQDPMTEAASSIAVVEVTNRAVVTSGDYQRYMELDGTRYHHIIDPDTGYPGQYARSVTVIGADSGLADVLSTAFFLMPPQQALDWGDRLNVGVIIIKTDGNMVKNVNYADN